MNYLKHCLLLLALSLLGANPALAQTEAEPAPPANPNLDYYAFELNYVNDAGKLSFRELAESGRPFVLVWWLADCQLCRMQMPYVQELHNVIRENELDLYLVSINIDDRERDCRSYIAESGLSIPVLYDMHARKTGKTYSLRELGTPLTYVFGSGGELIDTLTGYKAGYTRAVLELLDIPVPEEEK
jgi:thiol-disulfide isomerase/thioredoxin